MPTALEFLTELAKELIHCDPVDRQTIVAGYARHMEAREDALFIAANSGRPLGSQLQSQLEEQV